MINVFILKKFTALIMSSMLTVILFYVGVRYYGFWVGFGFMFAGLLLSVLVGSKLLQNPFTQMLEGQGIIAFNIDSTGIMSPFIVKVNSPYIFGKLFGKDVKDVFDRATVVNLAVPKESEKQATLITQEFIETIFNGVCKDRQAELKEKLAKITDPIKYEKTQKELLDKYYKDMKSFKENLTRYRNGVILTLNETDYNKGRFAFFHYPAIIYNEQIGSIVTKDFLADKEKEAFAEHYILYLNRKMEELTSIVRDFGRYIVELTKPKEDWFKSKWVIIILIFFLILMGILFIPQIIKLFTGGGQSVVSTAVNAGKDTISAVVPK